MPPKKGLYASTSNQKGLKGKAKVVIPTPPSDDSSYSDEEYLPDEIEEEEEQDPDLKKRKTSPTPRFINDEAQGKFCDFAVRPIHIETPFMMTEKSYTDTIISYGWQLLTVAPENCNVAIAKEFYSNAAGMETKEIRAKGVYVRGKYLKLTSQLVNKHYGLKDYEKDELSELTETGNPDIVLQALSIPGSDWVRNHLGNPKHVVFKNLTAEAKTWLLFINSRLMPTTHNTRIAKDMLYLVYAIKNKLTVDMGKLIMRYIYNAIEDETQPMFFPHFLFEYAMKQGLKISSREEFRSSTGPIGDSHLRNYQHVEKVERQKKEEKARENARAQPEIEEIREEQIPDEEGQHVLNAPAFQTFNDFNPMQNALANLQTSLTKQHNSMIRRIDAMDDKWSNFQTNVETRLDTIIQEHHSQWKEMDARLNQCQTEVHNLNLMMVYPHQSRGPNLNFPLMEELETQRMIVDTSSRRVVMQQGRSVHSGNNASNFNNTPNVRGMNSPFSGFSRFSDQPPPPGN